jgi:hypothetical protein
LLHALLAGGVVAIVVHADIRIDARIPDRVIDAVENADEIAAAFAQQVLQPGAIGARLDLAGVCRANCRDQVGRLDPGAQIIYERRGGGRADRARKLGLRACLEHSCWKNSLIADVVQREHGFRPNFRAPLAEQHRSERCMPIVAVNHVGHPFERRR